MEKMVEKVKRGSDAKRISVIGSGVSGLALAILAKRLGHEVFLSEKKSSLPPETLRKLGANAISWETGGHSGRVYESDLILLSSGIPPQADCVVEATRLGVPLMGELDFVSPHLQGRVVAVTGSNGKSTTTALIGHVLQKLGVKTGVGGNLGTAAATLTEKNFDVVVLELSSFQLARAMNLRASVSVVTNLAPDHLDWHGSLEEYIAAKARVLALRAPGAWGIIQDRDFEALKMTNPANLAVLSWSSSSLHEAEGFIFMDGDKALLRWRGEERTLFSYAETALLGKHNLENIAMSLAAVQFLGNDFSAQAVLAGFTPLPHRCEKAGVKGGVLYIDDSKGTNVDASVTAMNSIEGSKIVILGGRGKGEDYAPLARSVLRTSEGAVLLGEESDRIEQALRDAGFSATFRAVDMPDAVRMARALARPGMVVLLSPACTSWDMYDDYRERGEHFCSLVRALED
mgnify:CR=1 FL=1